MSSSMRIAAVLLLFMNIALAQSPKPQLFVVHFETGPAWNKALSPNEQPAFREHSANLNQLRKDGAIRFGARYEQYGMIFLEAESLDAARKVLDADPGVKAGTFVYRIAALNVFYPWQE